MCKFLSLFGIFSLLLTVAVAARAVSIDLVPVGNPGNAPDTRYDATGFGRADYTYWIGKYEVTYAQWREFLNAKASLGDPYGLYNIEMAESFGGIDRNGSGTPGDPFIYSAKGGDANWENRPVNYVSFWDAARFCNWLNNGQGNGDTETGAYIDIGLSTFARQPGALYFIPTEDEWYKAAYHKNDGATGNYWDYPTGTNSVPSNELINPDPGNNANFIAPNTPNGRPTIGSPYFTTEVGEFENSASPYGTFDQGGNVEEWNETLFTDSSRVYRGGGWANSYISLLASVSSKSDPSLEVLKSGFRVASVPEPSSLVLLFSAVIAFFILRGTHRKK